MLAPRIIRVLAKLQTVPANENNDQSYWVILNDFSVRPISEEEVFRFPDMWKVNYTDQGKRLQLDTRRHHSRENRLCFTPGHC
jgi:hypothetical protein